MDMKEWLKSQIGSFPKKAMPILSFPSISLLGISVEELISDSSRQAEGMIAVAKETDALAAVSMMDLSVEAEAFGSKILVQDGEVPTVIGRIVESMEDAENLAVPSVGAGRTGLYIEAIRHAKKEITDRPTFAGVIGPFSLAGRLMDMTEIMVNCYVEPEMVVETLKKATSFIIEYVKAFRDAGADGVVIAEPAAGLLGPDLNAEFSVPYMKEIVEATQTDDFAVIYHNCGNTIPLLDDILTIGAGAYHFGNAINMEELLSKVPSDVLCMGNIDPAGLFRNGTVDSIREKTLAMMESCSKYENFIPSSGCDIPPLAPWENIHAFFGAVDEFYKR